MTYSFRISEDRHAHPLGNPPGAWGTLREWSTWGGGAQGCGEIFHWSGCHLVKVTLTHDDTYQCSTECIFSLFIHRTVIAWVISKPPCAWVRKNWMENRHFTRSSCLQPPVVMSAQLTVGNEKKSPGSTTVYSIWS